MHLDASKKQSSAISGLAVKSCGIYACVNKTSWDVTKLSKTTKKFQYKFRYSSLGWNDKRGKI